FFARVLRHRLHPDERRTQQRHRHSHRLRLPAVHRRPVGLRERDRRLHRRHRIPRHRRDEEAVPDRRARTLIARRLMLRTISTTTYYGFLAFVTVAALGPILWVMASSLKTNPQILSNGGLLPHPLTAAGYRNVFGEV